MTEHNKVSHNVVTDAIKADINGRAQKTQNLADLPSATTARLNLGFPATASRYLRNDGSGAPAALGATESANLDKVSLTAPDAGGLVRLSGVFPTVASLLADTTLTYTAGQTLTVSVTHIIEAGWHRYEVAPLGASDHHLATTGGVKLYVKPDTQGRYNAGAWGADNLHDSTAEVIAACVAAGTYGRVAAQGISFVMDTVLADPSWSPGVCIEAASSTIWGYPGLGIDGVFDKGDPASTKDFINSRHSGHHPGYMLSNDGRAGSNSGLHKFGTILWCGGFMERGEIVGLQRNFASVQMGLSNDYAQWSWSIRNYAPPIAVRYGFDIWKAGINYTTGDIVFNNDDPTYGYYQATTTGTSGATRPVHTTTGAVVSDGGVNWERLLGQYDTAVFSVTHLGQQFTNAGFSTVQFERLRMSPDDLAPTMVFRRETTGASKNIRYEFAPTDGSGALLTAFRTDYTTSGRVDYQYGTTTIFSYNNSAIDLRGITKLSAIAANADTTPSILGFASVVLSNTVATSITTFDDGIDNQEIQVIAVNANSTLVHGSGMALKGATDAAMPAYGVLTLRKLTPTFTTGWIEVSRSF